MPTPIEDCLLQLQQTLLPKQRLPETEETTEKSWQGRSVEKAKHLKNRLAGWLRNMGVLSSKSIQQRDIRYYRYIRSAFSAGLLKPDFSKADVTEKPLPECKRLALELWEKNPFEYALWCADQQQPYPDHFLYSELIPWLMEKMAALGINRKKAAQLSIGLCEKVKLLNSVEIHNYQEGDALHSLESAEDYLDSLKRPPFSDQEQIELLQGCLQDLENHRDSRKLSTRQLFNRAMDRKQALEKAQQESLGDSPDTDLIQF